MKLNKYIDHTNLKPTATLSDIHKLCNEALKYDFASVCVFPTYVSLCRKLLKNTTVKVCTVVGFPFGNNTIMIKKAEAEDAVLWGANEIDFVVNLSAVKNNDWESIKNEMQEMKSVLTDSTCKAILETCLLTQQEIIKLCLIAKECNIDYVKTSTGYSTGGATIPIVELMVKNSGNHLKVKASGGIKTYKQAQAFIKAGASRIGTSNGVAIMEESNQI